MAASDFIVGPESNGNPYATNPRSSAAGLGQFIDSTWLDLIRRYRPDLTIGKTPSQILQLKFDPTLSKQMIDAYARENSKFLSSKGFSSTPRNEYLAHFVGPQGAASILSANPSKPVSHILDPDVIKANPFLANMTAGGLQTWASQKVGGSTPTSVPTNVLASLAGSGGNADGSRTPNIMGLLGGLMGNGQQGSGILSGMQQQSSTPISQPEFPVVPRRRIDLSKLQAMIPTITL